MGAPLTLPGAPSFPSWVDIGAKPIQGLDLLGLRLPVQAIGNSLLNGVTTVTPSVRYISLQAWIVYSYANARHPDRWQDFRTFASRVEAAVVLGNLLIDPKVVGAIGVDKAKRELAEAGDLLVLQDMVLQPAISIYANPCEQLGLTFSRDSGIPGLTWERGFPLAELIMDTVAKTSLGRRFSNGEVLAQATREELLELGRVLFIHDIPDQEADLLTNVLIPATPRPTDLPRIKTYASLLDLARRLRRCPLEEDIFHEAGSPKRQLDGLLHETLDGWLRYSVRDLIAVSHEAVLKEIVEAVQSQASVRNRSVRAEDAVGTLLGRNDDQREALRELGLFEAGEDPLLWRFEELRDRISQLTDDQVISGNLARWQHPIRELEVSRIALRSGSGALSVLPVAWLLALRRAEVRPPTYSIPFDERAGLGWSRMGLFEVIEPTIQRFCREGWLLVEVMAELGYRTVDQHLRTAWARMVVDSKRDVAVLISDGDRWWSRDKAVVAGRTASRLGQAIGWTEQLGLINNEGLTSRGGRILDRTLMVLAEAKVQ